MALPKDKPTLQSTSSGNWTRPDNVLCTTHTLDSFMLCNTIPRRRPPCTDHVPIISTLYLNVPCASTTTSYNFQEVDWEIFCGALQRHLYEYPEPTTINTEEQYQEAASNLTNAIKNTIEEKVPKSKPSPHAKRWWTKELTNMLNRKNELSNQSYKLQGLPNHPIHAEHQHFRNQ
ncbi:hypothetical protein BDR06DRAFT_852022, partial [Suillus hirtellus]